MIVRVSITNPCPLICTGKGLLPVHLSVQVETDRPLGAVFIGRTARVLQHAGWLFQRGNSNEYYYPKPTKRYRTDGRTERGNRAVQTKR